MEFRSQIFNFISCFLLSVYHRHCHRQLHLTFIVFDLLGDLLIVYCALVIILLKILVKVSSFVSMMHFRVIDVNVVNCC